MTTSIYNSTASSAARDASRLSQKLGNAQQTMSSGIRTNDPAKDPASAAVGATLQGNSLVLQQLARNTSNAVSVLGYAQAALSNVMNLLTQMKGMAAQALDPNLGSQLQNMDMAYQALLNQITSIGNNTKYLGTALLDGSFAGQYQIGLDTSDTISVAISTDIAALSSAGSKISSSADAKTAFQNLDNDLSTVSGLVATIAANQTQLQAALTQLSSQLGAENEAYSVTVGADVTDTLNEITTSSTQLQIAQSMIQSALEQQKALADMVKQAAR